MAEVPEVHHARGGSVIWPLTSFGLLAAGWLVYLLLMDYADRLREEWGPAPDVCEALGREAYACKHIWRYLLLVVGLDGAAAMTLSVRTRWGWPHAAKVFVALLMIPSAMLHGLAFLICGLLAD